MSEAMPLNELLALGFAVCLGMTLVTLLLYARGMSVGMPRRHLKRVLVQLWLLIVPAVALLIGIRQALGGPLVDFSRGQGVTVRPVGGLSRELLVAAAAAVVLVTALLIRRITRSLPTVGPLEPPRAISDDSDDES
jgi:hypothetical protein